MSTQTQSQKGENISPNPKDMKKSQSIDGAPTSPRKSLTEVIDMTTARRGSAENMTPEMLEQLNRRRASLDKLNVEKIAPWMHIHDFTDGENLDLKNK